MTYYFNQLDTSMKELLEALRLHDFSAQLKFNKLSQASQHLTLYQFSLSYPFKFLEFPLYVAASEDIDPSYDPLQFWRQHEQPLPAWSQTVRQIILIQPSLRLHWSVYLHC